MAEPSCKSGLKYFLFLDNISLVSARILKQITLFTNGDRIFVSRLENDVKRCQFTQYTLKDATHTCFMLMILVKRIFYVKNRFEPLKKIGKQNKRFIIFLRLNTN